MAREISDSLTVTGKVSINVTSPQGQFHIHDGVSGWLFVTKTSVGASAQTIIPNGTGDVTSLVRGTYILNDGSSATSGTVSLSQAGTTTLDISLGGSTWRVTLNANGALSVARTVGSSMASITFDLVWQ